MCEYRFSTFLPSKSHICFLPSPGSLVADFVAEYEDNEVTASDFTKANVDLITGENTIKLLNQSMSPSSIKVGDKKGIAST
jgi:hypothetical protein